jgi:hypothetical protein
MEETEELDLTGLEDALEIDETSDTSQAGAAGEDPLDLDLELEEEEEGSAGEDGDYDLSDLDMVVESEEEAEAPAEQSSEASEDFGMELDLDEVASGDAEDDEDVEFDLSDLDDMLEIEEEPESGQTDASSEFDLELGADGDSAAEADVTGMDEAADVELEFEEDDEPGDYPAAADLSAGSGQEDEGFDMGAFSDLEGSEDDDAFLDEEEEIADRKKPKRPRKKVGGFLKFLLVLVILGGAGYAGYSLTQFFGIEIPYLDRIKSVRIPYVSEFLGQEAADPGYLKIAVLERDLNGRFFKNARLGNLFVISGKVKNNYGVARNFITVTGKLYVKGRKLFSSKTVFAGNVLTDQELARFDQAAIDKFFKNRFGQKRANMNVGAGQEVPFMIVFSGLPNDLDEYTVEPAGSVRAPK